MIKISGSLAAVGVLAAGVCAQTATPKKRAGTKPIAKPAAVKPATNLSVDKGAVAGRTYINRSLEFEVMFPDTWLIAGDDFEAEMKKAGFDLGLKAPAGVPVTDRAKINRALKQVTVAMTAYRSRPGSAENAIVRVSLESLAANPQIKDAIDYFDAMRNSSRQ